MAFMKSALIISELANDGLSDARVSNITVQFILDTTTASVRMEYEVLENAYIPQAPPSMLLNYIVVEHIIRAPDSDMVSDVFPVSSLPGLTFDVTAMPMFSTKIAQAVSGKETRTSYWENPLWEFSISFDYLPDATNERDTAYKILAGFFMDRGGRFKDFLFKPTNQHRAEEVDLGTGDGVNNEFTLIREYGAYREPVGQYDPSDITIWVKEQPFTSVVASAQIVAQPDIVELTSVFNVTDGIAMTQVVGAPGVNQYSVNLTTGLFTFNVAQNGDTVNINYKYRATLGTNFVVSPPRTVVFTSAPGVGAEITGTYEYFFVCRFKEDETEFNQFMNRLYELDELTLRSQIL